MLSEKPWKVDAAALLVVGILTCMCSLALLAGLVEHFAGGKLPENSPWAMVFGVLAMDGPILLLVCVFLLLQGISWQEAFGFQSPGWGRALLLGVVIALVFLPVGWGIKAGSEMVLHRFQMDANDQQAVQVLKEASPGMALMIFVLASVSIVPLAEETLFRGILYPTIKQCGYPRAALWGTSFVFGLIHLNLPALLPLVVLAVALTLLYEKTGNLLACIAAHATFNAANVAMLYLT